MPLCKKRCVKEPLMLHRKAFDYNFALLGQDRLLFSKIKFCLLIEYLGSERKMNRDKLDHVELKCILEFVHN